MNRVYALSPKGLRECAASQPTLPAELTSLLHLIDGRRSCEDVLAASGKNALTAGGLRWLTASGYIQEAKALRGTDVRAIVPPDAASRPPSAPARLAVQAGSAPAPLARRTRTDAEVCRALSEFMVQTIRRRLGEGGYVYRRRIKRAAQVSDLLPHLHPLIDAIVKAAGTEAAAEFADTAAFILDPLDADATLN